MGNSIITFGIILIIVGILVNIISGGNIPLLPGDILIKKDNYTFYFPVVSSIFLSILLTVIFYFFRK